MRSSDIRERFLRFFEERGHHRLASSSLIPHDDPSLLFTVAGMVPLKPYISGAVAPPAARLVSCQKCFRGSGLTTDDIASVGDSTHHTFFEMLGNWSIGDYFKQGAIEYAWEFLTKELSLDPEKLWPSIYPEDAESERLWTEVIGVPKQKISRLSDNWWQAGPTGPCGFDSEVYFDSGSPCSCGRSDCTPQDECGGDRWVEIWNLVFMEFDQAEDGSRSPLPKPTVDTGMGLERITAVLQGVRSNYETDLFAQVIAGFSRRAGTDTGGAERQRSLNVLADHLRGAAFLIGDGVFPANEGRGYVLRRVIRRAALHGRRLQLEGGLAAGLSDLVETMGDAYPELVERQAVIARTLQTEEEAFARTLDEGARRLEQHLAAGTGTIGGDDAFKLYDTYGLPIELTVEMAEERGVTVDLRGFQRAMNAQKERSQKAAVKVGFEGVSLPPTRFVGYDTLEAAATVQRIGIDEEREQLGAGESGDVVLDVSPFYAEQGGQIGDTGMLTWSGGSARVLDTVNVPGTEARSHRVHVDTGVLHRGDGVAAAVDAPRRAQIARHHSATHLLHKALREVLGDSVVQRGSWVGPDHTTFDFAFHRALTPEELRDVESRVNAAVRHNHDRSVEVLPIATARETGAVALFGEKYGESVRVVDIGGWARELCGGTHVEHSGDIGAAMITGESSVGQGVRRIEMVVGEAAVRHWQESTDALVSTARSLRARTAEVPERVAVLLEQVKRLQKDVEQARRGAITLQGGGGGAGATVETVGAVQLASLIVDGDVGADAVQDASDRLFAEQLQGDGVAVVLGPDTLVVKVGSNPLAAGIRAGDLVRRAAAVVGGRGGGRPEFARGGVKDPSKREAALQAIREQLVATGEGE